MTQTIVAVVQMNSTADLEQNLTKAEKLIRQASDAGSQITLLPEGFAYLGPDKRKLQIAEPLPQGGPILDRFVRLAKDTASELVLGGFWERHPEDKTKVFNSCVVIGGDGTITGIYRKIHLFDVDLADGTTVKESKTVMAGSEPVVVATCAGKLGLSICYDVRFPELYRRLVEQGANILAVPAAFTATTGKDHWHVLLRARAIESQCYVLAPAQTGHHFGDRYSYGHALVVDPWGKILVECQGADEFGIATIDTDVINQVRQALPSLQHRRL